MTIKVEVPTLGESVAEATVASWSKQVGDFVKQDELIAELETDKVNLEVNAPQAGKITKIITAAGTDVTPGTVMAEIDETAQGETAAPAAEAAPVEAAPVAAAPAPTPAAPATAKPLSPAVRKMVTETGANPETIEGTGKDGRITKGDVIANNAAPTIEAAPAVAATTTALAIPEGRETRVPMSRLRKTVASRLKTAQNTAAMLTTYNEIDMQAVMDLRKQHQDAFVAKNGVKLGFMSFFTKAVIEALKDWPALNAEIDGEELVYKNFYDIGIAVSTNKGLMVPVVRNANEKSFAQIELDIKDFGLRGKEGKIKPDDLAGGTFTITNGGTFGSMLSMPILNYPQVGILGMHNIVQRPVAINGEVKIRPIMYVALTYDHRIVDGREAVSFLVKVKECLENPERMLLGV